MINTSSTEIVATKVALEQCRNGNLASGENASGTRSNSGGHHFWTVRIGAPSLRIDSPADSDGSDLSPVRTESERFGGYSRRDAGKTTKWRFLARSSQFGAFTDC